MTDSDILLELKSVTKRYSGVTALDKVDFGLKSGEVHALIGENGAGKSTLIKAVAGVIGLDEGSMYVNGEEIFLGNPQDAANFGISAAFQELSLIPWLSVAENIFLNKEGDSAKIWLKRKDLFEKASILFEKYGIDQLDPREDVGAISAAKQQLTEIMKAVAAEPQILILDEPTSSLTETETDILFHIIETLRANGTGIIYITHRMKELDVIADRVTVLRDGQYIGTDLKSNLAMPEIIKMMVGRALELYDKTTEETTAAKEKKTVLQVRNLHKAGVFQDISFDLHEGEILGIAGLVGSGRSELMEMIFGVSKADSGDIIINNEKVAVTGVSDAIDHGIAMVPESRHRQGLVLRHSVSDNIALAVLKRFQNKLFFSNTKKTKFSLEMIDKYRIKTESPNKIVSQLSGGNQQKVVVAKWFATNPKILIIDEPTAGIDVGAKVEVHRMIRELTEQGTSVLMISSEMTELLTHSDRIMVMNDNKILGIFDKIGQEEIMSLILKDKNQELN